MLRCHLQVYVLIDTDSDGLADAARAIITGLDHPNGVVWHDGALYVMTHTKLLRYDDIDGYALTGKVRTHLVVEVRTGCLNM